MTIYSSDGEVYDTPLHHELEMPQSMLQPPKDEESKPVIMAENPRNPITGRRDISPGRIEGEGGGGGIAPMRNPANENTIQGKKDWNRALSEKRFNEFMSERDFDAEGAAADLKYFQEMIDKGSLGQKSIKDLPNPDMTHVVPFSNKPMKFTDEEWENLSESDREYIRRLGTLPMNAKALEGYTSSNIVKRGEEEEPKPGSKEYKYDTDTIMEGFRGTDIKNPLSKDMGVGDIENRVTEGVVRMKNKEMKRKKNIIKPSPGF